MNGNFQLFHQLHCQAMGGLTLSMKQDTKIPVSSEKDDERKSGLSDLSRIRSEQHNLVA